MAIDNLKKTLSSLPFSTVKHVSENPDFDKALKEDCELTSFLCPDKERALQAVISTWIKLPNAVSNQHDNHRPRYHADAPRAPYRPIKEFALRRLLLLTEITKHQLEIEKLAAIRGQLPGSAYYLRCYCQQMSVWILNHTSWDTATAMTQIWRNYSAEDTLDFYHSIANKRRSETKDASNVSRTKDKMMSHQAERFGSLLQVTEKKPFRFVAHPSSPEEARSVSRIFKMLLPLPSIPTTVPAVIRQLFQGENMTEMNLNRALTDFDRFNALAAKSKIKTDEYAFLIPEFFGTAPNNAGSDNQEEPISISDQDIDRVKAAIHSEQRKRFRNSPSALSISVNGVTRCSLDPDNLSCSFIAEDGATIVDINATENNDIITLGTYVLMHDRETKTERWDQYIEGSGRLVIEFQYRADGTVTVNTELHVPAPYAWTDWVWKSDSDPNNPPQCHRNICVVGSFGAGKSVLIGALLQGMLGRFDEYQITGVKQTDLPPWEPTVWYHDHFFTHEPFKIDGSATVIEFETPQSERLTLWDISTTENNLDIEHAFTGLGFQPDLSIGAIEIARFDRREASQWIESLKKAGSKAVTIVLTNTPMSFPDEWLGDIQLYRCKLEVRELLERAGYSGYSGRVLTIASWELMNDADDFPEWAVDCLLDSIQEAAHPRSERFAISLGDLGEIFGGVLIKVSGIKKEAAREGGVIDVLPQRPLTWLYPFEDYFGRKSGWNRIYKKYLSLVSAIMRAKAFEKERSLPGDGATEAEDWKEFTLARAVWASLAFPRFHPKPPLLETRLCDLLCAFGKEDTEASAIAATIIHDCVTPTGRLNLRQLSMTLVRELKLPESAAWVLEESLGLPPIGANLEGGGSQTPHRDESCLV